MSALTTEVQASGSAVVSGQKKLALLGCGKLGTILLQAFLERGLVGKDEVIATVQHQDKCGALSASLGGVAFSTDNRAAVASAAMVLIDRKSTRLNSSHA